MLAAHFVAKTSQKHSRPTPQLDPLLVEVLLEYDWPGNVRELENLVERLVVLDHNPVLGLEFVPEKMLRSVPTNAAVDESSLKVQSGVERRMIINALNAEGGNKVAAAKRLGISRSYLHRLINEFGIQ